VEWRGADLFVYFDVGLDDFGSVLLPNDVDVGRSSGQHRCSLVARIDPGAGVEVGDTIRLWLAAEQVQLFDAESGKNLFAAADEAARSS